MMLSTTVMNADPALQLVDTWRVSCYVTYIQVNPKLNRQLTIRSPVDNIMPFAYLRVNPKLSPGRDPKTSATKCHHNKYEQILLCRQLKDVAVGRQFVRYL